MRLALFILIMSKTKNVPIIFRLFIYAIGIYIVEFASGFLLDMLTGSCPWEYKEGLHILGYIRLDYLPAWMGFGYLLEKLVLFFQQLGLIPKYN